MRFPQFFAILIAIPVSMLSCRPVVPEQPTPPTKAPGTPLEAPEIQTAAQPVPEKARPTAPARRPRVANKVINGISFNGVEYDSRTHRLVVTDQSRGPGSNYSSAQEAASKNGALLAINAGFFTPEGDPLGLVVSAGRKSGAWNSASSLGTGIYRLDKNGESSISRRGSRSVASDSTELLQAGPLLVENGSRVGGLSTQKQAVRSIVLTDGGTRWWIGRTSSCNLASLASALAQSSPAGWQTFIALNLDGGRSSDLYVSGKIQGGPAEYRGIFNRPVRNFLLLEDR